MTDAQDLWADVVASYDNQGLIDLTNIRERGQTSIDTAVGEDAAQAVINLWPIYAQETYDSTDAASVEVAKRGTIAMLWQRGGSAAQIAKIEWDEVFSDDGLIVKLKRTGPRARQGPQTNSGVTQATELTSTGRKVRPWSDPKSLPTGYSYLPRREIAED